MMRNHMAELIIVVIVIALITYFTLVYVRHLKQRDTSVLKATWQWIKDLWDTITGLG